MSRWVVLVHIGVAFWFVAGLLGRNLTLARARSSERVESLADLVFVPRRRLVDRALAAARALELVVVAAILALMVVKPF